MAVDGLTLAELGVILLVDDGRNYNNNNEDQLDGGSLEVHELAAPFFTVQIPAR